MSEDVGHGLDVTADLHLDVDDVQVQVSAQGQDVRVSVDDLGALLRSALATPVPVAARGRRTLLTSAVGVLDAQGLTATVSDATGPVLVAGRGTSSPVGRLVFGTNRVRMLRPRTLIAAAAPVVVPMLPWRRAAILVLLVAAMSVVRRREQHTGSRSGVGIGDHRVGA